MKILNSFGRMGLVFIFAAAASCCFAQQIRVPTQRRAEPRTVPLGPRPAVAPAEAGSLSKLSVQVEENAKVGDLISVTVTPVDVDGVTVKGFTDKVELTVSGGDANVIAATSGGTGIWTFTVQSKKPAQLTVTAIDTTNSAITKGQATVTVGEPHCEWIPIRADCNDTIDQVNGFFSTESGVSYFTQIKSIYNSASTAAIISADIATLNFQKGMQLTASTNITAGSSTSQSSSTNPAAGGLPTLTSAGAAQAAQNMLNGGTLELYERYPLLGYGVAKSNNPGNLAITLDLIAKEGVDIQNFKSGTSTQVNSPPVHVSAQGVGYLVYNAINPPAGSTTGFAGSVFLGGAYGYSYTSHGYILDYGIANRYNRLGQVSAGVLINGIVNIAVSRGFGPSQTYFDSTNGRTVVNNFKAWSIGISYQSAPKQQSSSN